MYIKWPNFDSPSLMNFMYPNKAIFLVDSFTIGLSELPPLFHDSRYDSIEVSFQSLKLHEVGSCQFIHSIYHDGIFETVK